ncbi:hypothetical protein APHAL10511_002938 [Amanita phalloides]|nr:hypothetical protein APHAL10511_002938 [Amanita phalloides]
MRSSRASSLSDSQEPRQPPPEYRHYIPRSRTLPVSGGRARDSYLRGHGSEYADESEEEQEEASQTYGTRVSDATARHDFSPKTRRSMLIRGRTHPSIQSTTSSDADVDFASASSASSMAKMSSSPVFGSNLKRSLQIDMKDLVGDSVANMSISPGSRDIVLAARQGMYVIDLEKPLEVPRFLPQGGIWHVADVQWNPHPTRAEYIVSNYAEKLLIWNLLLVGRHNVEHILQAHYRAITDINWHTTERDTVVSTGVDSWVWAWDLRDSRKPVFGLSAFKFGGTQVKWNRQDGNILASSHANDVYIWDRRKGSLPVTRIRAHSSKIYGIDWSHDLRNEIVTCSLDKSIKVWDISDSCTSNMYGSRPTKGSFFSNFQYFDDNIHGPVAQYGPKRTIKTHYPVWRARYLPFGRGILSLAQRGETALEMYALNGPEENNIAVEVFEGHTDVVKEFVWRKGDHDEFQLITWSKDRTLKFWPVDTEVLQKVGYALDPSRSKHRSGARAHTISFRDPPDGMDHRPRLFVPIGTRPIIAETRPAGHTGPFLPKQGEMGTDDPFRMNARTDANHGVKLTMSRVNVIGKSAVRMDAFTWLSSVKVGDRKDGSSGPVSKESDGRSRSRLSKGRGESGTVSDRAIGHTELIKKKRSESRSRAAEAQDLTGQALQDEITSVLTKLTAHKIKLEKHDLTKKRNCTLGLYGPWGESLQVFIRVTFTFPRDYPYAHYPHGVPTVEVERNPLIPVRNRAFMLRRLRIIREQRRPCLEACLRFLLFGDEEEEQAGPALHLDSESSSEEESTSVGGDRKKRKKGVPAISMLRNHKNLAEPRTSQGTFGPNGELVCFFRASPRIVRNMLRGLTNGTASGSEATPMSPASQLEDLPAVQHHPGSFSEQDTSVPRLLRSPSLVSDAVWKLGLAAKDRGTRPLNDTRRDEGAGGDIVRVMADILAFSRQGRDSDASRPAMSAADTAAGGDDGKNYAISATRSTVFLVSTNETAGPDKRVAVGYKYSCAEEGLRGVCMKNANNARTCGRYDHERVFKMLQALFAERKAGSGSEKDERSFASDTLAKRVIMGMYTDFAKNKDVQMLGILSMLVLQTRHCAPESVAVPSPPSAATVTSTPTQQRFASRAELGLISANMLSVSKFGPVDYFNLTRAINSAGIPPSSPDWPRLPAAPTLSPPPILASATRGPWSSLFGNGVRQFVQETFNKEGQTPSSAITLDPSLAAEKAERKAAGRPLSSGSGISSRLSDTSISSLQKQQQPSHQKKGKQRDSLYAVAQPQPQSIQTVQQQMVSGLLDVPPPPPPLMGSVSTTGTKPSPSLRTRSESVPGPLKASLSFSSTSSGGSSGGGTSVKRSPLVPVENLDLALKRRGGKEVDKRKRVVLYEGEEDSPPPMFNQQLVDQFKAHVHAYAEILHRWEMDHQRLELLRAVSKNMAMEQESEDCSISVRRVSVDNEPEWVPGVRRSWGITVFRVSVARQGYGLHPPSAIVWTK